MPKVLGLITAARSKGALIIYSVAVPGSVSTDVLKELAPATGETVLPPPGPDKFIGSDLEKMLKEKVKDVHIVDPTPDATLTLFACHPPHQAIQRYVVRGVFVSSTPA